MRQAFLILACFTSFVSAMSTRSGADDKNTTILGRQITELSLKDYLGTQYQLDKAGDGRLMVVAFLGTECPLAKLYAARLVAIAERYAGQGVIVWGINSNRQDTPTEIAAYARQHKIKFPLLKDPGNQVADQFGATRTPEVFVLDEQRIIRYYGRIDDQFGVGYAQAKARTNFLEQSIEQLLAGQPVTTPRTEAAGCLIGRVARREPTGTITYSNQIARILTRRCVECHRETGIAPFALTSYEEAAGWAETLLEAVDDRRMPPWHANPAHGKFANQARMPVGEKQLLRQWIENGTPQGDRADLPPTPEFAEGWRIGQPDRIFKMPEPFAVPSHGVVPYQYFTVDPGFTEGQWIKASEARPGVRSVVHHIIVFVQPPGGDPILKEQGVGLETLGGYVPGAPPLQMEDGIAVYVPAHSKLVLQMHYTPDGTERQDRSEIGIVFADPAKIRKTMQSGVVINTDFTIPPGAKNHRVEAMHRFSHDFVLYALAPHMHFRGKAFRYEAIYPNGTREVLLDIPRYDFNWQNNYRFERPKFIPEGTQLRGVARFDNSADNLSNPDPSIAVRWGEQTWEEMMIGFFEGVYVSQDLSLPGPRIAPAGDGQFDVTFRFRPNRPVKTVALAGTFNDWNNSAKMSGPNGQGVYSKRVRLPSGAHRYKFVMDKNLWTHDPASRQLTGITQESYFVLGEKK